MDLPGDDTLRLLVTRTAAFLASYREAIGTPELVLPNGEFFPDEFRGDAEGVAAFFKRMLSYAPLSDELPVALRFVDSDGESEGKSCSSGACSSPTAPVGERVREQQGAYVVDVHVADTQNAMLLATTLARSTGTIVLLEAEEDDAAENPVACEVAAVACGFGVLLANGSYIYKKGCGGVRVHQGTRLSVAEHGVLLALFARTHDMKASAVRASLDVTPRESFDTALEWLDSNPDIVEGLRSRPEAIAAGLFSIEPTKGFFGRLFGKRRESAPATLAISKRARSEEEERRIAESRALVDEALSGH